MKAIVFLLSIFLIQIDVDAQYFNTVLDFDSTNDWGTSIIPNKNGGYFLIGVARNYTVNKQRVVWLETSPAGNLVTKKYILTSDSVFFETGNGWAKELPNNNGYIFPANQIYIQSPNSKVYAGVCKIDKNGDTLLLRGYNDIDIHTNYTWDCDVANNGDYVLAGTHYLYGNTLLFSWGMLNRVDSNGNLKWSKYFKQSPNRGTVFGTVQCLSNTNILVSGGELVPSAKSIGSPTVFHYVAVKPWYLILDSSGNILFEKFKPYSFAGSGVLNVDKNGGYYHFGVLDTFITNNVLNIQNLPYYITHLNDSFDIDWRYSFADTNGKVSIWNMKQLIDSSYLVIGHHRGVKSRMKGWAAKFDKAGSLLWEHTYFIDSTMETYFVNSYEEDNGDILITGNHKDNQNLPAWRRYDIWFLKIDSMGCPAVQCAFPTPVNEIANTGTDPFIVYPNPTMGELHVKCNEAGLFVITDIAGREILHKQLAKGNNKLYFPANITGGIYMARFKTATTLQTVKIIYNP